MSKVDVISRPTWFGTEVDLVASAQVAGSEVDLLSVDTAYNVLSSPSPIAQSSRDPT